jgi:hypothetical protein
MHATVVEFGIRSRPWTASTSAIAVHFGGHLAVHKDDQPEFAVTAADSFVAASRASAAETMA